MGADATTVVTGASGFVGQYVLAGLLRRGARCVALVRAAAVDAARLRASLSEIGVGGAAAGERLGFVEGRLPDELPGQIGERVRRIVHVAGCTQFERAGGEPFRTNAEGTRQVLAWADALGIRDVTLVSTAYVCGMRRGVIEERVEAALPSFRNAYEESKRQAEQLAVKWAAQSVCRLVIVRPTIVAGAWASGRATAFRGIYVVARSIELLARSLDGAGPDARQRVRLRLPGWADGHNQIVPVDFVGEAIAHLALDGAAHGVYHLAHPAPPTNGEIKQWLEEIFDVGGGEFVGEREIPPAQRSAQEAFFYAGLRSVLNYFAHSPQFGTLRAESVLGPAGIVCPRLDVGYLRRCVAYAQAAGWGRVAHQAETARGLGEYGSAYFERFLPEHLPRSVVARVRPVRATVRFVLGEEAGQQWTCRFDTGRLTRVCRGANGMREEFGYRATAEGFWSAIGGQVEGEQLFLGGEADVFGDVEKALKMSAILREFTREFPCDRRRLDEYLVRA